MSLLSEEKRTELRERISAIGETDLSFCRQVLRHGSRLVCALQPKSTRPMSDSTLERLEKKLLSLEQRPVIPTGYVEIQTCIACACQGCRQPVCGSRASNEGDYTFTRFYCRKHFAECDEIKAAQERWVQACGQASDARDNLKAELDREKDLHRITVENLLHCIQCLEALGCPQMPDGRFAPFAYVEVEKQ